jgi:hypothetical protein
MGYVKRAALVLLLLPCLADAGLAEERHHRDGRNEWRGEIGRFHENDMELWRGGRWHHGRHDGRNGWWWIVGSVWYFYPMRVEPYPDPYQPPVVVVPPPPAQPMYWYYCASPTGYYPYVARCSIPWQRVPADSPPPTMPR